MPISAKYYGVVWRKGTGAEMTPPPGRSVRRRTRPRLRLEKADAPPALPGGGAKQKLEAVVNASYTHIRSSGTPQLCGQERYERLTGYLLDYVQRGQVAPGKYPTNLSYLSRPYTPKH